MLFYRGKKIACDPCITGHRTHSCNQRHFGCEMLYVRSPGKPPKRCSHGPCPQCNLPRDTPECCGHITSCNRVRVAFAAGVGYQLPPNDFSNTPPLQHGQAAQVTQPAQPIPAQPAQPVQLVQAAQTDQSVTPVQPDQPAQLLQTVQPNQIMQHVQAIQPAQLVQPVHEPIAMSPPACFNESVMDPEGTVTLTDSDGNFWTLRNGTTQVGYTYNQAIFPPIWCNPSDAQRQRLFDAIRLGQLPQPMFMGGYNPGMGSQQAAAQQDGLNPGLFNSAINNEPADVPPSPPFSPAFYTPDNSGLQPSDPFYNLLHRTGDSFLPGFPPSPISPTGYCTNNSQPQSAGLFSNLSNDSHPSSSILSSFAGLNIEEAGDTEFDNLVGRLLSEYAPPPTGEEF